MNKPGYWLASLALLALIVYLFVQAPAPLPDADAVAGQTYPVKKVFRIVAAENDVVRALWTGEIVGKGKKVGLSFDENWRDHGVEAGPLPALFLREAANSLEKNVVRLSLFLGSDYPINPSNLFKGEQLKAFQEIKKDRTPRFFYVADTGLKTAMFPDVASVQPCVSCHNEHPDSPKKDWALNDVMGATTWSYPDARVTLDQALNIIAALRQAFRDAYSAYLDKVATFAAPPPIGDHWPRDGYYLPSVERFLEEFERRASPATIAALIELAVPEETTPANPDAAPDQEKARVSVGPESDAAVGSAAVTSGAIR